MTIKWYKSAYLKQRQMCLMRLDQNAYLPRKTMVNIHRTPEQWQQIFKQHASSDLQIAAFCKQQKLNPLSFYAWRKRLTSNTLHTATTEALPLVEKTQDDWVNIIPGQATLSKNWDVELALPNGIVLRMMNS